MTKKINLRLSVIALIAVLATAFGTTFAYFSMFQARVGNDLEMNAKLLSDTGFFQKLYEEAGGEKSKIDQEALKDLNAENLRITWISADGTVLYDNDTDAAGMGNHLDRPEIVQAIETGSGESIRRSDTLKMDTFYHAIRLSDGTVLRLSTKASSMVSLFVSAAPIVAVIIVVIMILCILIGRLLIRQLIRPINKMAEHLDDNVDVVVYGELEPFAEKIRVQHDKILEAAKSRQDFTANISHELKTPLTAISGYAELIENHMIGDGQEVQIAKQIRHNSNRLLSLINDSIRLSELDHTDQNVGFEFVNLYKIAEDCCKALRINASQRNITLSCTGTNTMVNGDREMLKELVENLIQNAIRYNKPDGWVRVKVTSQNNRGVITVSDSGIGIPKEHQERIFERFYRVDKSRSKETGGTGLGLAIVKHIVELHDAQITVESEVNVGTSITVEF